MPDLICTACGLTTSYADAYFADRDETCGEDRFAPGSAHEWVEPLNENIDVVTG